MIRYRIRICTGDNNTERTYHFVHKDYEKLSTEEQDIKFNEAVEELNRIYKNYGRFATNTGVIRLFSSYGFNLSPR